MLIEKYSNKCSALFNSRHPELLKRYKNLIDENLGEILDKVAMKINADLTGESSEARLDVEDVKQIVSDRSLPDLQSLGDTFSCDDPPRTVDSCKPGNLPGADSSSVRALTSSSCTHNQQAVDREAVPSDEEVSRCKCGCKSDMCSVSSLGKQTLTCRMQGDYSCLPHTVLDGSLSHVQSSPGLLELGLCSTKEEFCQKDIMDRTSTETQPSDRFGTSGDQSCGLVLSNPTVTCSLSSLLPAQSELAEVLSPTTRNAATIEYWSSVGTQNILSLMQTGSEQQTISSGIRSEVEKLLHECMKHLDQRSCSLDISEESELGEASEPHSGSCQMKLDQNKLPAAQSPLPTNMSCAQGELAQAQARHSAVPTVLRSPPLPDVIWRLEEEFMNCKQQGLGVSKSAGNLRAMELASDVTYGELARQELQSVNTEQQPCLSPCDEQSEHMHGSSLLQHVTSHPTWPTLYQQPRIVPVDQTLQCQSTLQIQQHVANMSCCKVVPCNDLDPLNSSSKCCKAVDARMLQRQQQQGVGGQPSAAGLASALAAEQWHQHQLASMHLAWKEALEKQQLDSLRQLEIMQLQMEQASLLGQTGSELHSGSSMPYRTLPGGLVQNSHQVRTVQVVNQEDAFNLNGQSCRTESNRGLLMSNDVGGGLAPLQFPYVHQMPSSEMQRQQSLPALRRTSLRGLQMSPAFMGSVDHLQDLLTSLRCCGNEDSGQLMSNWMIGDASVTDQVDGYSSATCQLFGHHSQQLNNLQNQMLASSGRLFPFVPCVDQVPASHLINRSCGLAPVNHQVQCPNLTQQQQQLQHHQQCLLQRQLLLQSLHGLPPETHLPLQCNIVSNPVLSKPNSNVKST